MLLKAGTYRFNDVLTTDISVSDIGDTVSIDIEPITLVTDVGVIVVNKIILPIVNIGVTALLGGGTIDGIENNQMTIYLIGDGFNGWTDPSLQTITVTYDQTVDDTFGAYFIANTNYNEVNPTVDTIYTEKSSWYKSVADAIRNKKGTSAPILRDDFAREIESISVGEEVAEYDGTVIIEKVVRV